MSERSSNSVRLGTHALIIGAGVWIVWKIVSGALDKFKEGADKVGKEIGDAIVKWTLPAPVGVVGKIVIQSNGALLSPTQYPIKWVNSSDPRAANYGGQLPTITYAGAKYVLGPSDLNGNYPAVKL